MATDLGLMLEKDEVNNAEYRILMKLKEVENKCKMTN